MFTVDQIDTIATEVANENDERHGHFVTAICKAWLIADLDNKRHMHDMMTNVITKNDLDRVLLK